MILYLDVYFENFQYCTSLIFFASKLFSFLFSLITLQFMYKCHWYLVIRSVQPFHKVQVIRATSSSNLSRNITSLY